MRYGIIGNCSTSALVHESGSVDWCCLPRFDSPSVFARILDDHGGGFRVAMLGCTVGKQSYIPKTTILVTEFDDGVNACQVIDFMPRCKEGESYHQPLEIHRLIRPLRGTPSVVVTFDPRLNYAEGETRVTVRPDVITASNELESVFLYSSLPLQDILDRKPIAITNDQYLLLNYHERIHPPALAYTQDMLARTQVYWEKWSERCRLPVTYADVVLRSALTLKLLTYDATGAIVAAPTTSLPEILNDERNWDYRYCWLRDASLMLEALKSIGQSSEARRYIRFLLRLFESKRTAIQIMYGIDGRTGLEERILPHLKGYKNSAPVRIGNHAHGTRQNDIFGEILNSIYLYYFHYQFEPMTDEVWSLVKFLVNTTAKEWMLPDGGIWEYRQKTAHFTFSKVLSWVSMDRGVQIAEKLGKHYAAERWKKLADEIRENIQQNGWNDEVGAYTQIYGSRDLDVSILLMNRCGFIAADDPRWISTVRKCEAGLLIGDHGFRYINRDEYGFPKTSFILATVWIAKALHSIGDVDKARHLFEKIIASCNPLGLLSEDIDVATGELLGNFPQAYSHMGIINLATLLDKG